MKKISVVVLITVILLNLFVPAVFAAEQAAPGGVEITEYDKIYYGTISRDGQSDLYTFTTGSGDAYYYFTLYNESGTKYAYLTVYSDRDVELLKVGDYTSAGKSAVGNVKLTPNTTYYIRVSMNNGGTGNYSVKISYKEDQIPNNRDEAVRVVKDTMYYQSIDGKGDSDWYFLETDANSAYYYFYLKNESGTSYVNLQVYNERDAEVLSVGSYTSAGKSATENIRLEPNSKYYLRVYMSNNGTGNYAFRITNNVDEVGNSKDSASEIQANRPVSSSINGSGDVDFFVFKTGSVSREYQLIYNNETGTKNGYVVVYSERDEELLRVGKYTGAGESASGTIILNADSTYYFKVYLDNNGVGGYSFKLTQCVNGHTPSGAWTTITEPDCIMNGERIKVCAICGETVEFESVDALGHDFSDKEVVNAATLTSPGSKRSVCPRCGEVEYFKDWSKVWILPVIILGGILVLIGVINYARAFRRR